MKMSSLKLMSRVLLSFTLSFLLSGVLVVGDYSFLNDNKVCTNIPPQLNSHTFQYQFSTSKDEAWKKQVMSHYHLNPTDESAWMNLHPTRKMLGEEDEAKWVNLYRSMKYETRTGSGGNASAPGGGTGFLKEVSLKDVKLVPNSIYWRAQQTNLEYLLMLDVDRFVWSFRKTAGLPTPGTPYGGWEAPNVELRGHFVGHYLSASAMMWASTQNATLKDKMTAVVSALSACQQKIGNGYLSAFPPQLFDKFEAFVYVWAPYYTIHKIMAGLLDQYVYVGNQQALDIVKGMADYFNNRVQNVIQKYTIDYHYATLNTETGGMNDVLYNLYRITGDPKHLNLAHLFDKPCFLGLLAVKASDLSGFHANTHIPVVVGAQNRHEITGDPVYKEIPRFFMDIVNSSHSYPTGGTSVSEHWTDPKRLASNLTSENEETCTTYNMLKVSRTLFRWTKEIVYADYYERALMNGILSVQRGTEPGVMIYFLPLQAGGSKARSSHGWGTKFDSFWCCYGTAIESFSKLGDSIYFEEEGTVPVLYINQYIQSTFDWKLGKFVVNLLVAPVVSWFPRLQVDLTISSQEPPSQDSTLNLRVPTWANEGPLKAMLNGQPLRPVPGNFLSDTRKWNNGDRVTLELFLSLRTEQINDDRPEYASVQAILYGPYLLAGLSSGDWDIKTEPGKSLSDWITPVPQGYNPNLISLSQVYANAPFVLSKTFNSTSMQNYPQPGTDAAAYSTFRVVPLEPGKFASPRTAIGQLVALELYNLPGSVLIHQGKDEMLILGDAATSGDLASFYVRAGLDSNTATISLESKDQKGCYIYSTLANVKQSGAKITLSCNANPSDAAFKQAVSFKLETGISSYDPISFIAKGKNRSYLLSPLYSIRDESYTVYFNITSAA